MSNSFKSSYNLYSNKDSFETLKLNGTIINKIFEG